MAYVDHFVLADDLITHLDPVLASAHSPFLESRYTGFVAVSTVTVLELAIKTIFLEFAHAKHRVLGQFCEQHFERMNGRIRLRDIREDYLPRFGQKYERRFVRRFDALERQHLAATGQSISASYGNLITWRHSFAHEGQIPQNATYLEVKRAYDCGKRVMQCLAGCMIR